MNELVSLQQLPQSAVITERVQETDNIFTIHLRFSDERIQQQYQFSPGQFNMLYLYGAGEVPISIVSDPQDQHFFSHTIRVVGRVTRGLSDLRPGDQIGVRGPFGQGWPLTLAKGNNILIITGGLGCAPVVSVIYYVLRRMNEFQQLYIIQGLKNANDMIWKKQYAAWAGLPNVTVRLAADVADKKWRGHVGRVTELIEEVDFAPQQTRVMMCGPEPMMVNAANQLSATGYAMNDIFLSLERNMQCATGHCGHCQLGPLFVCKEGPVVPYAKVASLLCHRGI